METCKKCCSPVEVLPFPITEYIANFQNKKQRIQQISDLIDTYEVPNDALEQCIKDINEVALRTSTNLNVIDTDGFDINNGNFFIKSYYYKFINL